MILKFLVQIYWYGTQSIFFITMSLKQIDFYY